MDGIYARGPKTWRIAIEFDPDPKTGKRRQKFYTFHGMLKEAKEERTRLLRQRDVGQLTFVVSSKTTVAEYLEHWVNTQVAMNYRPKSYQNYHNQVRIYLIPTLGALQLTKLTSEQIREAFARLATGKGLAPRSLQLTKAVLHKALDDAVDEWKILSHNPMQNLRLPRVESETPRVWNEEEVGHFLTLTCQIPSPYGPLFWLALHTGMRPGEYLALRWQDLRGSFLQVCQTVQWLDGKHYFGAPKTRTGRRRIDLSPEAIEILRTHHRYQLEEKLKAGPAYQDQDLVFAYPDGSPLSGGNVADRFRSLVQKTGLPRISLYHLRHTMATTWLAAGVHPKVVSERLGHSKIAITMDTYSAVLPGLQSGALHTVESHLSRCQNVAKPGFTDVKAEPKVASLQGKRHR